MKILQKQKRVYDLTCGDCLTKLELDDSDFSKQKIYIGGLRYVSDRVSVRCPVCGKSFTNIEKVCCRSRIVPVEDNVENET